MKHFIRLLSHTFVFCILALSTINAAGMAFDKPVLKIGLLDFESETSYSTTRDNIQAQIVRYLQSVFPDHAIEPRFLTTPQLIAAIDDNTVDIFLASSGLYVEMQSHGVRDVGTLISADYPDPNHVVAGAMIVKRDRSELQTLADLQHKRAVSTHPLNFMTYQLNMGEIAARGYNPDKFFAHTSFTNNSPYEVLKAVLEGHEDVGLLRHCMLENLSERFPEFQGQFRVVNVESDQSVCLASTSLYPGWTMAVTAKTSPEVTRRLVKGLLSMPLTSLGRPYAWSVATDYAAVNTVLRNLRIGPYAYLREWTVKEAFNQLWPLLCFGFGLLLAGLYHFLNVRRLVIRRTAELEVALRKEREADNRAMEIMGRLEVLQRVSAIGQMSSMLVHELGQPLLAMSCALRGMETLYERNKASFNNEHDNQNMLNCLKTLKRQHQRTSEIILRVRNYAKSGGNRNKRINLCEVATEMLDDLRIARKLDAINLSLKVPKHDIFVTGNKVELGLVVYNLVKNAAEELKSSSKLPELSITIDAAPEGMVRFEVVNNGRPLNAETVELLQEPLYSTKAKGLGLGIMITRTIVEAHRGRIRFTSRAEGGLQVEVLLPVAAHAK